MSEVPVPLFLYYKYTEKKNAREAHAALLSQQPANKTTKEEVRECYWKFEEGRFFLVKDFDPNNNYSHTALGLTAKYHPTLTPEKLAKMGNTSPEEVISSLNSQGYFWLRFYWHYDSYYFP